MIRSGFLIRIAAIENVEKELTLPVEQFIRCFFLHVRGQQPADVRRRLSVIP